MGHPSKRQIVLCLTSTRAEGYEEIIHRHLPCSYIYSMPYGDCMLHAVNLLEKTYVTKVEKKMAELDACLSGCFMRFPGFRGGLFKTFGRNETRWDDVHFKTIYAGLNVVHDGVVTWESKATRVAKKTTVRKADDKRSKVGLEEANQRLTNELETSKAENERLAAQLDEEKAGRLAEASSGGWQHELEELRAERAAVVAIEKKIFDENLLVEKQRHSDRVTEMNRRHYAAVDDMRTKYVTEIKVLNEKVNVLFLFIVPH